MNWYDLTALLAALALLLYGAWRCLLSFDSTDRRSDRHLGVGCISLIAAIACAVAAFSGG